MGMPEYHKRCRKAELRTALRGLLPPGFWRLLQYWGYRRRYPDAFVSGDSDVGAATVIGEGCAIWGAFLGSTVRLGRYTTVGVNSRLGGTATVEIGQFCSISQNCFIFSRNHNHRARTTASLKTFRDPDTREADAPDYLPAPIVIGNDVWIGRDAKVLAGAEIGHGCVVGAGAVVTAKKHPPYAILGGVPARVIGQRFPDAVIEELLALKWWDMDTETIFSDAMLGYLMDRPE